MNKKGLLIGILSAFFVGAGVAGVGVIVNEWKGNEPQTQSPQIEQVYEQYVVHTNAEGQTPLSYEEWLESIKGEDGKSAYQIWLDNGRTGTEEDFLEWLKANDAPENIEGFDFYLLDNGTYGVRIGNATYLSKLVIPATYNGRAVTEILENFGEGNYKEVVIPDSVTTIRSNAFYDCSSLTSITIPDSVTTIGDSAFDGCYKLTSVTIPDSVTSIGCFAFHCCSCLTSVTIGNSVAIIGDGAFFGCDSLISVNIPDSVTVIGGSAFFLCSSLESVYIKSIETWCDIDFRDGSSNNPLTNGANLYLNNQLVTNLVIPNTVTQIKNYAFSGGDFETVAIPASVTFIGEGAFEYCSSLTSVEIPNSVTTIGKYAFRDCESLEGVYVESIESWCNIDFENYASNPLYYAKNLYLNNQLVTNLVIPDTVTQIKDSAFEGGSFETVTIPNSITSIGEGAFVACENLIGVTIPNSVTTISNALFGFCSSLTSVIIPDSVTSIGSAVFAYCSNLTSITIPDTITSIGEDAFWYCSSLTSVTIPDSITSIKKNTFYECGSLTNITIPDSIRSIGDEAFGGCDSLNGVYIESIESWCNIDFESSFSNPLYYANNLYLNNQLVTDLVIPNSIIQIKDRAFEGGSFKEIKIPNSVTSIGILAFSNCSNLTSVTIPNSITSIPLGAFYGCDSLISVEIPNSVTTIGPVAFFECDSLISLTIPDSVTSIGRSALWDCKSLTSVTIGNSVATIEDYAFYSCESLIGVTIGNSVTSIGENAFYGCFRLTSVTIPKSVTFIGEDAFFGCNGLTNVTFENTQGWYCNSSETETGGTRISSTDLANTSIAAEYLTHTYTYYGYYWERCGICSKT